MRIESLKVFVSIVETESLSAASRREHLSQSAVSSILTSLEQEIGQPLIERSRGQRSRLVPTLAGTIFFEYAQEVVRLRYIMLQQLERQVGERLVRPLNLITGPTLSVNVLPVLLQEFAKDYPETLVKLQTYSTQVLHRKIQEGDYDIAISTTPLKDPFICEVFFYDPHVLICSRDIFIKDDRVSLKRFQKLPLVTREPECLVMKLLTSNLNKCGLLLDECNIVLQVFGNFAVKEAVQNNAFCGFVTLSSAISSEADKRYRVVEINNYRQDRYIYLIRKKNTQQTPELMQFWQYACSSKWRKFFSFDTRISH